jgi:gluconokinase
MLVPTWIGIDIGTTGVRAVAYAPDGHCHCAASREYQLKTPQPGWAEQNPDEIVAAVEAVLREVALHLDRQGRKPDGIAFSSVFHSFLAYDRRLRPISSLMTWADNRSHALVTEMKTSGLDFLSIYRRVGCPVHPMYPLAKIAWVLKQRPGLAAQSPRFGSIKDYVFLLWTGEWVVDHSIASGSGLYNFLRLEWDRELMQFLGISEDCLPEVVPTTYSRACAGYATI